MESQPQNPEFWINPENFHPCFVKTWQRKRLTGVESSIRSSSSTTTTTTETAGI